MQLQAIHTYVRVGEHVMKSMPMGIFTVTSPLRLRRRHDDGAPHCSKNMICLTLESPTWRHRFHDDVAMTMLPWRRRRFTDVFADL